MYCTMTTLLYMCNPGLMPEKSIDRDISQSFEISSLLGNDTSRDTRRESIIACSLAQHRLVVNAPSPRNI